MIKTAIIDIKNSNRLTIEDDGSINAYIVPTPPKNVEQIALPYSEYLMLNGNGSKSMVVNGSVTNQSFYIEAKATDIYINTLVFTIADAGATLNNFGSLSALTNGLDFFYFNQTQGQYIIESGLKSNFDMIRLANFEPSFGSGNDAFRANNVVGTSEAYVGTIDLEDIFGLQWGLKLRANTTDKVGFIVKDNLTGLDDFNIKVYGIKV
jgi:hypothetical protein